MSCISRWSRKSRSLLLLLSSRVLGETSTAATTGLLDFAAAGAGWGVGILASPPSGEVGAEGAGWGVGLLASPPCGEVGAAGAGWGVGFSSPPCGEVGAARAGWGVA